MAKDLEYKYRRVRKAQAGKGVKEAWWYMNPGSVQIFMECSDGVVRAANISKKQLRAMFA